MVTIWTVGLSLLHVQEGGIDGLSTCLGIYSCQTTKFWFMRVRGGRGTCTIIGVGGVDMLSFLVCYCCISREEALGS